MEVTRIDIFDFKVILSQTDLDVFVRIAKKFDMSLEQAIAYIFSLAVDTSLETILEKET